MKKMTPVLYLIIFTLTLISFYKLIDLIVFKKDIYLKSFQNVTNKIVTFPNSPRGRILDVNGKILVDNIGIPTLIYNAKLTKESKNEIEIALTLVDIIDVPIDKSTISMQKKLYLKLNNNGNDLISKEEWDLYEKRKLNQEDIEILKLSRIDENMLAKLTLKEKKASYIYHLMTTGYSYQDKIIKKKLTATELAKINEQDISGIRCEMFWERTYPYGNTLKTIFGNIGPITKELLEHYKNKVSLDSIVGISSLELKYDDYLRGTDAQYKLNQNGFLELIEEAKPGNDLYLTIDIDIQLKTEEILEDEMTKAKTAKNSDYYNHSFVLIGNPNNGNIIAMTGLLLANEKFSDITINAISSSYTVGSIVKGASITIGYQNGIIDENTIIADSCIKLYGQTEKCSWTRLGRLNDINALAYSSNYFQFLIATKLANPSFISNGKLNATKLHFDTYRNTLKSFGLGSKTEIDLLNEQTGIVGTKITDDLLLNLSIGQYDTYTPVQILQYINTIANNGERLKLNLINKIVDYNGNTIFQNPKTPLNKVKLEEKYLKRIQTGFRNVMVYGTGSNYTNKTFTSAGKTGTSETFVDTNKDGAIDTKTISTAFVMYAPFDNPKYSIAIISPHIAKSTGENTYKYSLNLKVNQKITKYLFENR